MADLEKFSDKINVVEKSEKQGQKGMYYALKTEKGLVYNVNETVVATFGGIRTGDVLWVDGVTLPPKGTYTHGSRWVNSYSKDGESQTQSQTPSISRPAKVAPVPAKLPSAVLTPSPKIEGFRTGQAINLAAQTLIGNVDFKDPAFREILFARADAFVKLSIEYEKGAGSWPPEEPQF